MPASTGSPTFATAESTPPLWRDYVGKEQRKHMDLHPDTCDLRIICDVDSASYDTWKEGTVIHAVPFPALRPFSNPVSSPAVLAVTAPVDLAGPTPYKLILILKLVLSTSPIPCPTDHVNSGSSTSYVQIKLLLYKQEKHPYVMILAAHLCHVKHLLNEQDEMYQL